MDRLEIDYHLEAREGERTVDEIAHRLEELLSGEKGLDEPVFVSKAMRGPLMEVTIICHVRDADAAWARFKPYILEKSVPGDFTVKKMTEHSSSPVIIFPEDRQPHSEPL